MKKLLISLIVFFSSFLLINKINAQTNEVIIYDYTSNKFQDLKDNYNVLEDVIDYINDHNTHNFSVLISYKYDSGNTYLIVGVNQRVSNSNTHFRDYQRFYIDNISHLSTYYYSSPGTYSTQNSYCYFNSGTQNCNTNTQLNLSNYTQSDLQTFYTNINSLLSSGKTNTNLAGGPLALPFNNSPYSPFVLNNQDKFTTYVWSNKPINIYRQNKDIVTNIPFSIQIDDIDNSVPLWNSSNPPTPYILTDYKTWYDSQPHTPSISFTSQTFSSNNQIYENDVTIDFGIIDNDNYYYMYLDTNENIWHSLYLTTSTSYTINLYDNTNIIAQVIDKNTGNIFTNASYLVNNISSDLRIDIINTPIRNENEQEILFYNTNITYYSDNRNNYIYEYTTSNYLVNGSYEYIELQNNETNINFRTNNNITIIARIKDLQGNFLYTKTTEINSFLSEPKISFTEIPNYGVSNYWYNSYIDSVILNINYGYIDTTRYIYLYKKDTDENWTTFNPLNYNDKSVNLNINENTNIIARVLNKNDNSIFSQATYTIYKISSPEENSSFLGTLKNIFGNNDWRNLLGIFTNFFNTISENRIITYILLIITTSIIILLLKSMKR